MGTGMKGENFIVYHLLFWWNEKVFLFFEHNTEKAFGFEASVKDQASWKE
jgi:hypothetical protein